MVPYWDDYFTPRKIPRTMEADSSRLHENVRKRQTVEKGRNARSMRWVVYIIYSLIRSVTTRWYFSIFAFSTNFTLHLSISTWYLLFWPLHLIWNWFRENLLWMLVEECYCYASATTIFGMKKNIRKYISKESIEFSCFDFVGLFLNLKISTVSWENVRLEDRFLTKSILK